jgi:hypothetical protein
LEIEIVDPIGLMLLTVAVNALVTGVLLFIFQKRFESRYAKRQFEDQVKFQRMHEKRVEALENLHKKLSDYTQSLVEAPLFIRIKLRHTSKSNPGFEITERVMSTVEKWKEFIEYFESSIKFLPDIIERQIGDMVNEASDLHMLFLSLIAEHELDDALDPGWVNEITAGFITKSIVQDRKTVDALLDSIHKEMIIKTKQLEHIYKSVAHTDD